MVVCSCHAVSDRAVRDAVADGACTLEDVAACTEAGRNCGGCWATLEQLLDDARDKMTACVATKASSSC